MLFRTLVMVILFTGAAQAGKPPAPLEQIPDEDARAAAIAVRDACERDDRAAFLALVPRTGIVRGGTRLSRKRVAKLLERGSVRDLLGFRYPEDRDAWSWGIRSIWKRKVEILAFTETYAPFTVILTRQRAGWRVSRVD